MRVCFKTFGCKANSLDTDILYQEALKKGYKIVAEGEMADAFIVNSCTVTHQADKEARRSLLQFKQRNPHSKALIIGCYAQVAREELSSLPYVDYVIGTADKLKSLDLLKESDSLVKDHVSKASGFLPSDFAGSTHARASIKIQDGCNFKCSYCIIPQARGRSRSLPLQAVIRQVEEAQKQGFEEVVLTGIHLAHYGWEHNTNLEVLLKELLSLSSVPRIRLTTLDPFEISDELIALVTRHPKLCPHFHIALQSGSDLILKRMRRLYEARQFVDVTQKIKDQNPFTFVGVDVIVGFPGETDEEFQKTVDTLNQSYITKLHVFPFSVRKNTAAESFLDQVPAKVKKERSLRLRKWSDQKYTQFLEKNKDLTHDVILEKRSSSGVWKGHTANYLPVLVQDSKGSYTRKKIYALRPHTLHREALFV